MDMNEKQAQREKRILAAYYKKQAERAKKAMNILQRGIDLEAYKATTQKNEANDRNQYLTDNRINPTPANINKLLMSGYPVLRTMGENMLKEKQEQEAATTEYNREQDEKNRQTELANNELNGLSQSVLDHAGYDIDQETRQLLSSTNPAIKRKALVEAKRMVAAKEKERAHYSSEQFIGKMGAAKKLADYVESEVRQLEPLIIGATTDWAGSLNKLHPASRASHFQEKVDHINKNAKNLGMMLAKMNYKNTGMEQLSDKEGEQLQNRISALVDAGAGEEATLQGIKKTLRLIKGTREYMADLLSLGTKPEYDPSQPQRQFKFLFDVARTPAPATAGGGEVFMDENGEPSHILLPNGRRVELDQELRNIQ